MRTRRQRNADVKLVIAATVAILLSGFVIAAGIFVAVGGGGNKVTCGRYPVGTADGIRSDLETGGPQFQTGGGNCSFWLTLDQGDIVAYKTRQPDGCNLKLHREKFVCGSQVMDVETLQQYPVSIITHDKIDTIVVDLTGVPPASTSSTTTAPG